MSIFKQQDYNSNCFSTKEHKFRRIWHMLFILVLCYYLVPEKMFYIGSMPVDKDIILLILFLIIGAMEFLRLTDRWDLSLFREYERKRVSAPFWFASGTALIVLVTPQWFAVPCILTVIIADPIIGELRVRGISFYPFVGFIICFGGFLLYSYPIITAVILGTTAVLVEMIDFNLKNESSPLFAIGILDDNFLMQFVPAVMIAIIWLASNQSGFSGLLPDIEPLLKPLY